MTGWIAEDTSAGEKPAPPPLKTAVAQSMNPSYQLPATRQPGHRRWLWAVLLSPLLVLIALAAWAGSCFHLSSDLRALRDAVTRTGGGEWRQQIALNANWLTSTAIRAGLSSVRLDPAVRAALQSVSAAGVGVYQLPTEAPRPDRISVLTVADKVMAARGWGRVVLVINADDLVAIYSPAKDMPFHRLKCCIMVFSGRKLVLVSAQGNPGPLVEFAIAQSGPGDQAARLAQH